MAGQHAFRPDPWGKDICDAKVDEDGRVRTCARSQAEHGDAPAPAATMQAPAHCRCCGDAWSAETGGRWRWSGQAWEHRCDGIPVQAGHVEIAPAAEPGRRPAGAAAHARTHPVLPASLLIGTVVRLEAEVRRARGKFPGNRFLLAALTEEVGELARALLQRQGEAQVQREALQVACVALRILEEGDASFADVTDAEALP